MAEKACKFLLDTDKYFTNEIVDVTKFNNSGLFTYKCPLKGKENKCITNNERINALGVHLYQKLVSISNDFKGKGDNGNRHIEIFIMWLGNKLYNLENNYTITLEESYKRHLEKYMPNFNYWAIIDSKKEYKRANVWYMSELYKLLNCICNIVIEYNKNNSNNKNKTKIENYSSQCYEKFKNVYNNVKDCYSYFHLLKFLKSIYDDIRNDAIKDADDKKDAIKQAFITNNSFKKAASYHKNNLGDVFEKILNASTISLIDLTTSDWDQMFLNVSDKILDFHTQLCINSYSELVKKQKELESKNQLKVQPQTESDKSGKEANQNSPEGPKDEKPEQFDKIQQPPSEGKKTHGQSKPVKPPIPSQPQAQIQQLGSPPVPLLPQEKDSSSSQKDSSLPKSQTGDSDNGKENTGGANGNKRDPRDPTPNDPAPSDPSSNTPGEYFYWWSSFNGFLFDRTEIFNKASQFIDKSRQTVKEVTDKINSAYTSAVDNLKSAYTVSNNYISGVVNSVTTKLNPFSTFQLGDNKSEPGYPVNGGNEPNPLQSILPPDSPLPKSPDSQGSSTQIHKCPVHQIAPTDGNMGSQTPPSGQGALSISGSNPSNTKKENVITMANVKMKEAPSIWCIRPNTKCDITGISIIVISIFVFLVIMYKYLSLGCTSKSERKKNIKKVINSIGGKRPVQIIIKSYDRNKHLKPVINSVGRKKYPLLNIYKLMQADPVPFVNLFFLLIFFVYKRKSDFLEL